MIIHQTEWKRVCVLPLLCVLFVPAEAQSIPAKQSLATTDEVRARKTIVNRGDSEPMPEGTTEQSAGVNHARSGSAGESGVAPETDEFQDFVAQSLGRRVPVFGRSLFTDAHSKGFQALDRMPIPGSHKIAAGDEIVIRAWGQIDVDYRAEVDRNGNLYIPKLGTLALAGLRHDQLDGYMRTAFGRLFSEFDLNVSLGKVRSIQVVVVGRAREPGTYSLSSHSTLVNGVFAAGGPSHSGSLRHIQLRRGAQVVSTLDLYELLLKGEQSQDLPLLHGDVIHIGPMGMRVAIAGSVNEPAIYEMEGSSKLQDAIEYAGGLTSLAADQDVIIERISERRTRLVNKLSLSDNLNQELQDGDIINIRPITARFGNAVTLRGNVTSPGRTPWIEGMRISDLIPSRGALLTRSYWLQQSSLGTENQASSDSAQLRNRVRRTAPEVNWHYALIERMMDESLSTTLIPFNLEKAIVAKDETNNHLLQPGDVITIFSQDDVQVPQEYRSKFVRLEGEFRAAGIYRASPGEMLRGFLSRVGAITPKAYLYGAQFIRESLRADQQMRWDKTLQEFEMEIEREALIQDPMATTPEHLQQQQVRLGTRRRLLDQMRVSKPTGRLVLNIGANAVGIEDLPDLELEDGDLLLVPFRPAYVNVLGAVSNDSSLSFEASKTVSHYLREAGGYRGNADPKRSFVIRASGKVVSATDGNFLNGGLGRLKVLPGDTIVVPYRLSSSMFTNRLKDWSQIIGQFAIGAALITRLQ